MVVHTQNIADIAYTLIAVLLAVSTLLVATAAVACVASFWAVIGRVIAVRWLLRDARESKKPTED